MNIVIIGVGNIGYYLTRSLLANNEHDIRIIENDMSRCVYAADRLQVPVVHGDGTKISSLKKVRADKADILVALTGKDEDNFIVAQLAKEHYNIKTVIVKSNNPKNLNVIKNIPVEIVISSADLITNIIEQEVNAVSMKLVTRMNMGDASLIEFDLNESNSMVGKTLSNITLPDNSLVVTIVRNGLSIIPKGDTTLLSGDNIVIFTKEYNKPKLVKLFDK